MKLDKVQRWVLANQLRILAALYPREKDDYQRGAEALEHGYELEYEYLAQHVYDEGLTEEECREVLHTMDMYFLMQGFAKQLPSEELIEESRLRFPGYDGNNETMFMAYARYLRSNGRFTSLDAPSDFNSHDITSRIRYRRMLPVWEEVRKKISFHSSEKITRDDIMRVLDSGHAQAR